MTQNFIPTKFTSLLSNSTKFYIFAFSGSGWVTERKYFGSLSQLPQNRPTSVSSYIHLPSHLQNCNFILNIWNHKDNNCLICKFVAASYQKKKIQGEEGQNDTVNLASLEFD